MPIRGWGCCGAGRGRAGQGGAGLLGLAGSVATVKGSGADKFCEDLSGLLF